MPSPFTWDTAKPAGTDAINIGDNQIRDDKGTLRDVLRTLVPFGTPTTGWRVVQINNDIYIVHNAKFDGTNWSHDDTAVDAKGIRIASAGGIIELIFRAAAASTWLTSAWTAGFVVNPLTGLVTLGNGTPFHWAALTDSQLAADNTTRYIAVSGVDTPDTTEGNHNIYVLPRNIAVVEMRARVTDAVPGGAASRTITFRKNSADTAATATITGSVAVGDWSGNVALVSGDLIDIACAAAGTPAASRLSVVLRVRETA